MVFPWRLAHLTSALCCRPSLLQAPPYHRRTPCRQLCPDLLLKVARYFLLFDVHDAKRTTKDFRALSRTKGIHRWNLSGHDVNTQPAFKCKKLLSSTIMTGRCHRPLHMTCGALDNRNQQGTAVVVMTGLSS
ncbi:hypothetical protein ZWY2020_044400 [Hordeum vulgare]|nr:hypothetical protein ZWY2020_044400 [Hordeum vulgare]